MTSFVNRENRQVNWWVLGYFDCISPYTTVRKDMVAAPTVAELGEALPAIISIKVKGASIWAIYLNSGDHEGEGDIFEAPTEADVRALCWLYLKEKGLI
jgi:hypothetical protein